MNKKQIVVILLSVVALGASGWGMYHLGLSVNVSN